MTHRPVRSLAALLAVLMVLFAFPALPIFAAGNVTSITIVVPEGVNEFTLYDGSDSEALYFSNADTYEDLVLEGEVQTPASIKINGLDYTLTKNGERSFTFKPNSGSFIGSVRLGILADSDKLSYKATGQGQSDITKSLNLTVADSWGLGELYYIEEVLQFGRGDFSKFNGEVTMTFSVPEKEYTVTYTKAPAFTLYDKDGNEKRSPITVKTSELTDGKDYEFQIGLNSGYTDRVPNVSYYMGDDHTSNPLSGTYDSASSRYKYKIEDVDGDIELYIDIMAPVSVTWSVQDTKGNPLSTGAQVKAPQNVPFGGDLKFTVTAMLGYSVSGVTVNGTSQDITLKADSAEKSSDEQTVTSVTESQQIVVTVDKVKVTAYGGTGYSVAINQGRKKVEDGWVELAKGFEVEVKLEVGFTNAKPTVTVNGRQYTDDTAEGDGVTYKFNVSAVGTPTTVTVNGVSKNQYTVTLPSSGAGYSVSDVGTVDVTYGGKITFRVTLEAAYKFTGENIVANTDLSGKASVVVQNAGNVYTVTVSEIKDNIVLTLDTEHITAKTFRVSVDGGQTNFKIVQFGKENFDNVTVGYNEQVSFTVTPNTGYWIESVSYTTGEKTNVPTLSGSAYVITGITSDVEITVVCTAIKVKVTYIYPDLTVFGNKRLTKADEVEEYSLDNNAGGKLSAEGGFKLTLKTLDDTAKKGVRFEGWTYNGRTVAEGNPLDLSSVTVASGEINIQVTANWHLIINDSATDNTGAGASNGAVYVTETPKNLTKDTDEFYRLSVSGSLQSALQNTLWTSFASDVDIVKVGMVYAKDSLTSEDLESYRNTLLTMPGSGFLNGDRGNHYAYVHNENELKNFTTESSYTQKVNFGKDEVDEGTTRYASIFFVVEIGGQRHVIFGAIQQLSYVAAG